MMSDIAQSVGYQQTKSEILPLIEKVVQDEEFVVRQHVALQFPALCSFLVASDKTEGYQIFVDRMLPLLAKLIADQHQDVRTAAGDSLVSVASLVPSEDQGQYILTTVLPLAHEDENEELRITAVVIFNNLAETLGRDLCHQFLAPELVSLSEDSIFRVRKATALNFHNVCRVAGPKDAKERLLPAFIELSQDDIWGVRKACAESLVEVAKTMDPVVRATELVHVYESLSNDTSKWVRGAAFQHVGPFLATLSADQIPDTIISSFLSMATVSGDDLPYYCAYSFPAVVVTLGKSRWSELALTFADLSIHPTEKVRRTLAYSLHELAQFLGSELTESDLLTAFEAYLGDVDSVRLGVICNLANFIRMLNISTRAYYVAQLDEICFGSNEIHNWRIREIVCRQLPELCGLLETETIEKYIQPVAFKFLQDQVASVRQCSFQVFPILFQRQANVSQVIDTIQGLSTSENFMDRQSYIRICDAFLSSSDVAATHFETHFQDRLLALAKDAVSNVRLVLAQVLSSASSSFLNTPAVQVAITALQNDTDADIVSSFSQLEPLTSPPAAPVDVVNE